MSDDNLGSPGLVNGGQSVGAGRSGGQPGIIFRAIWPVLDEQQINHQPDDFSRGEVFPRRLVRSFRESPDEFLENVTHLDVVHDIGMQVDLGELAKNEEQQV